MSENATRIGRFATPPILLAALLLSGCGGSVQFADLPFDDEVNAVDGATLLLDGERIRLDGVVPPRPAPEASCRAEAALADAATKRLEQEVSPYGQLEVTQRRPDGEGGVLATVIFQGRNLSEVMLQSGLVASATVPNLDWCAPLRSSSRETGDRAADDAARLKLG